MQNGDREPASCCHWAMGRLYSLKDNEKGPASLELSDLARERAFIIESSRFSPFSFSILSVFAHVPQKQTLSGC